MRFYRAWIYTTHLDIKTPQFLEQTFTEALDGIFGGAVSGLLRTTDLAEDRADIDDMAAGFCGFHVGDDGRGQVEDGIQVGVHHLVPLVGSIGVYILKMTRTCIVDEDVGRIGSCKGLRDPGTDFLLPGNVEDHRLEKSAPFPRHGIQIAFASGEAIDFCSFL